MGGLDLASVVRQLRADLNEALDEAEGERLRFELGPVELSLTVTVGREAATWGKDPVLGGRGRSGCEDLAGGGSGHQARAHSPGRDGAAGR